MIDEPKQKNKVPDFIILALLVSAIICAVFGSFSFIMGRGILQTIALVFFCLMIFVLVKYKYMKVRYTIRKKDSATTEESVVSYPPCELELVIERAQGSRSYIIECLVALEDITEFVKVPDDKLKKKELYSKYIKCPKYKYFKNLIGAEKYLLEVRTASGFSSVEIECGESLRDYLSAVARYNKESIHSEE